LLGPGFNVIRETVIEFENIVFSVIPNPRFGENRIPGVTERDVDVLETSAGELHGIEEYLAGGVARVFGKGHIEFVPKTQ
jgi:hypothetical protein